MTAAGALDRGVALVALVVLSPVMALTAGLVRLTSPGPAFFRQARVGLDGRQFEILKFRTMVDGAERMAPNISPGGDPRVTPLGGFLRSWYLDELPQLVNVLRGDMRLVGPRPETPEYVALYTPTERRVLTVKPGLVGASTLAFMDEAQLLAAADDASTHYEDVLLHQRVGLDLSYLERRSFGSDLQLLFRQAVAILRH